MATCDWSGSRAVLACLSAMTVACGPPAVEPDLALTARPADINDIGEETTVSVVATTAKGTIGAGTVTLTSGAGSLKDGVSLTLDAYGTARTTFSCAVAGDAACVGVVKVTGVWNVDGKTISTELSVRVMPPPNPWENSVTWDTGARLTSCSGVTPPQPAACNAGMCPHGFGCLNGVCLLNGAGGGLQYTLRFGQSVDLDLHLVEPRVAGGVCEVFWADRGGPSSTCGARSSLDLDSNADCNIDNINIENIILPRGKPVPGTYIARVDLFRSCRCAPAPSAGSTADSSCPLSRTPEGRCPASP